MRKDVQLWGTSVVALAIGIVTAIAAHGQNFPAGDPERGSVIAKAKCAVCHGADGNSASPEFPKLAGQNPDYLYAQLATFRSGARQSDVMSPIVAAVSDADLADAASFYARQAVRPDKVTDKALASVGERIFFNGAGHGMAPACAMCHGAAGGGGPPMMGRMPMMGMMGMGMMGRGMMANVPNLNGQHATYIVTQLERFATGERQGMMMGRIAASLSEADMKAVAEYLSGLR